MELTATTSFKAPTTISTPGAMNTTAGSLIDTTVANERKVATLAICSSTDILQSQTYLKQSKPRHFEDFFPSKLYCMLEELESPGLSAAVSWQPNGRAFIIKDKQLFMTQLVPKFCKATKYRSFQRQCGLWGFHRIPSGRNTDAWWHELFVRGRPEDLKYIVRTRLKSMAPGIRHVPTFYDDKASIRKKASVTNKTGGTLLVSANSSSDRDEEFEHLDEEFEALICERALNHETETFPRRVSTADSSPNLSNLNRGSDRDRNYWLRQEEPNLNPALTASDPVVLSSNIGQKCVDRNLPRCSRVGVSSQPDVKTFHPDSVTLNRDRDNVRLAQVEAEVELDDFASFIDRMIQQLP